MIKPRVFYNPKDKYWYVQVIGVWQYKFKSWAHAIRFAVEKARASR